jgi:hypothetical protein
MGAFEAMKSKASGTFRSGGATTVPLLVTFDAADFEPKKSQGEKDSFTVTHVRGGLDRKAGEQETVRLDKFEKRKPTDKDRPSLLEHLRGKDRIDAAKPGTVYLLQGAKRAADGTLLAHWVKNLGPALGDADNKLIILPGVLTKVVSISNDKAGNYSKNFYAYHIDANRAVRVGGKAQVDEVVLTAADLADPVKMDSLAGKGKFAALDDAIKAALTQQFAGNPGFIMRVIEDDAQDKPYNIQFIRPDNKVGEEWVAATPDEALAAFIEGNKEWYEGAKAADTGLVEIVPFVRVRAGPKVAERAIEDMIAKKAEDPTNKYPKDRTSEQFYGDVVNVEGKKQSRSCYIDSVVVIRSMDPASGYYFWTDAYPMERKKFADAEVITDNIAPALAAKYEAAATERGKYKPRDPKAEQAPEPAEENFGDDPAIEAAATPSPGR